MCFSCGHVTAASRKEMVFVTMHNTSRAIGRVIFKKTGKETQVGRENIEDT